MTTAPIAVLTLLLVLAGAAAFYGRGSRLGSILASLVLGPVCYFLVGVAVPRATGEGRFFSTPFGGVQMSDMELVTSIVAWTLLWFALLAYAKRKN